MIGYQGVNSPAEAVGTGEDVWQCKRGTLDQQNCRQEREGGRNTDNIIILTSSPIGQCGKFLRTRRSLPK